ncbi:hypothetical protein [Microbacterium lacticum]
MTVVGARAVLSVPAVPARRSVRAGAALASVLLIGTLAGCGASRPSDADRASWQSWATDIVASAPDAAVSGEFAGTDDLPRTSLDFAVPTAVRELTSLSVSATSADAEGAWTARLRR